MACCGMSGDPTINHTGTKTTNIYIQTDSETIKSEISCRDVIYMELGMLKNDYEWHFKLCGVIKQDNKRRQLLAP